MKNLAYVGLAALLAGAAFAASETAVTARAGGGGPFPGVGSVISSFQISTTSPPYALGIYRDASYVYGVMYSTGTDYLRSFTTAGSVVGSVVLTGATTPRGAAHSHLGSGYVAICDATTKRLNNYAVKTGSQVTSFSYVAVGDQGEPFYNGTEYYICRAYSSNSKQWYRFTTTGSLAGVWTASGYPFTYCRAAAFTKQAAKTTYMIASEAANPNRHAIISMPHGDLIRSWSGTLTYISNGGICGPGAPTTFGTTYWVNTYIPTALALWAFQWDLGKTGVAVTPTSLGKVKSLYR